MLLELDLPYIPPKSTKERAISNFLADLLIEDQQEKPFDLPDEEVLRVEEDIWVMYFDGTSNQKGFEVTSSWYPQKGYIP